MSDLLSVSETEVAQLRLQLDETRREGYGLAMDLAAAEAESARLRAVLSQLEHDHAHQLADAAHEGWSAGVRNACAVHCPDVDEIEAITAVEQSGLEENAYLARLGCACGVAL